jgi:hypothetical protein
MHRARRAAATPLRLIVEIELAPPADSGVNQDSDRQVLFPARIVVNGKPIQTSRSQTDWFLVKSEDWYLHLAWGARQQRPKGKK